MVRFKKLRRDPEGRKVYTMDEMLKTNSYLLGELVSKVQEVEEILVSKSQATAWREDSFILFQANFANTAALLAQAILQLPEETKVESGEIHGRFHLEQEMKNINLSYLEKGGFQKEEYTLGYCGQALPATPTTGQSLPDNKEITGKENTLLSRDLGGFIALAHCMEVGNGTYRGKSEELYGEDIFFLLNLNFENTIGMLQHGISNLPSSVFFRGENLSKEELKAAYEPLANQELSPAILDKFGFVQGYDAVIARYHGGT